MAEGSPGPDLAASLLTELARAVRARQLYPPAHPALSETLEAATRTWAEGLRGAEELVFDLRKGGFSMPGGPPIEEPTVEELAATLRRRAVRRLRVHPDLEPGELLALIDILASPPEPGSLELEPCLDEAGIAHITTKEIDFAERFSRPHPRAEDAPAKAEELRGLIEQIESAQGPEYEALIQKAVREAEALLGTGKFEEAAALATMLCEHATAVQDRSDEMRAAATEGLERLCDHPKLVDWLVVWTRTAGGSAIVRAAEILRFLGASALPRLLEEQSHSSAEVRDRATAILITMADQAFPVLVDELSSDNPLSVRRAARLLGKLQNPQAAEFLVQRLRHPDDAVRREAAQSLATLGADRARGPLIAALNGPTEIAELAVFCLGAASGVEAVEALVRIVDPRSGQPEELRKESIKSLGRIGSSLAVPMLTRVLEQRGLLGRGRDRELKIQAAQALGKIGGRDAQAVLEAALPTRDPDLRRICEQSLRRLAQAEEA